MISEAPSQQRFSSAMVASPSPAAHKKKAFPGQAWSHAETVALIEAYEEKWTELRRGQLRAHQWEEVADSIAARCSLTVPSKNGTQCRHKVEKLRKRYRAERARPVVSAWPYFDLMDRMERGGATEGGPPSNHVIVSTRRNPQPPPPPSESEAEDDDEDAEIHTRSINGILNRGWGSGSGVLSRVPVEHNLGRRSGFEGLDGEDLEDKESESEDEEDEEGSGALVALASVVRTFGERYERLEKRKMEMMRQMEMERMEMETKREELLLNSQRCLLESVSAALSSRSPAKKAKKPHDL